MPQMKTDRSMIKTLLLSLVTCGIYGIWFYTSIGNDINLVASRRDGKKTMHYCLLTFVVLPLTCGISSLIWFNNISTRIGDEARARGIQTNFGAGTFWLWNVLGSCIVVGPFIYMHKLCETMNAINADVNARGM